MYKYIISTLVLILCSSCFRDRIELDLNENNEQIVITGFISTLDEEQYIKVTKSVNYLDTLGFNPVINAQVSLTVLDKIIVLQEKQDGFYFLPDNWIKKFGENYVLEVRVEDDLYSSEHTLHPCPEIENARYRIYDDTEDSVFKYETLIDFQEFPGKGDAYYGVDYLKGSMAGDSLNNASFTDDEFIDGNYLEEIDLSDEERLFKFGDTAIVEIYSIGVESANFLEDVSDEVYRGGPFDAPPSNVGTNIEGGALGYFIIGDARKQELVIN